MASSTSQIDAADVVQPAREDGAKRRQILDGARRVFLSTGFDGASMNEVARAAGVSKGTLYVYFASKQELFAALLRDEKREQAEQLCRYQDGPDLRANLQAYGVRLAELLLRPESVAHLRTVMAVAPKFPEIGRAFYEAGPETGRRRLARYLDREVEAGRSRLRRHPGGGAAVLRPVQERLLPSGAALRRLPADGRRDRPAHRQRRGRAAAGLRAARLTAARV